MHSHTRDSYRFIPLDTALVDKVRARRTSPGYGHPAHEEVATGHGPCRHCLRTFQIGEERSILFTCNPFAGVEELPQPGPVFIHAEPCVRYDEHAGFPEELRAHPLTLVAYDRGRVHRDEVHIFDGAVEPVLATMFARNDVAYVHVRDLKAGCYDLRVERGARHMLCVTYIATGRNGTDAACPRAHGDARISGERRRTMDGVAGERWVNARLA